MKVAFLVTRTEKPSARYRVAQFLPYLRGRGMHPEILLIPRVRRTRRRLFETLGSYDVVVIQKKLFRRSDLTRLRRAARKLAYDFDDAVMFNVKGGEERRKSAKFARVCEAADVVICGNGYLRELASRHTEKTVGLPTSLDTDLFVPSGDGGGGEKVVLGWIGSHSTLKYLIDIMPAFEILAKSHPETVLSVICDTFPEECPLPVERRVWSGETEIFDLQGIDIGLMPLRDDLWTRGKCGFKILQYFAVGKPVVCSPVGVNREIVEDCASGFWARGPEEWAEKIGHLIEDVNMRRDFGARGREKVVHDYSLKSTAPKLEKILRDLETK